MDSSIQIDAVKGLTRGSPSCTGGLRGLEVEVCDEPADSHWDKFVATSPRGHHVQSSLWANVKSRTGWRCFRVLAKREGRIRGGVQVLLRRTRWFGLVGYAPKGPVVDAEEPYVVERLLNELDRIAATQNIRLMAIQPPSETSAWASLSAAGRLGPFPFELAPTATVEMDLSKPLDTLLAEMRPGTRSNVRRSQRRGIKVRLATDKDLPNFHRLLSATAHRQGFVPESLEFYRTFWDVFASRGHLKLFMAEHDGEPVSALLAVAFGGTVLYKRGGWSGRHGDRRPNESMHWSAIKWAQAEGYRYYDFEGISRPVAKSALSGSGIPESAVQTLDRFKLGFGGSVVLSGEPVCLMRPPPVRWAYNKAYPIIVKSAVLSSLVSRARN